MTANSLRHIISTLLLTALFSQPSLCAEELKDDIHLVKKIRELILKKSTVTEEGKMKDYRSVIPKTGISYDLIAIKDGDFLMGSPANEKHRKEDEGPQHKVHVEPFWMGKFEVTWAMFEPFMMTNVPRSKDGFPQKLPENPSLDLLVSSPTAPHMAMDYGMGKDGFPAISMTQHAASKFCQWLSAQTGHYYRLPTEAEWEYACRAGTTTAYSFGNNASLIKKFAIFDAYQYAKVGSKEPNPWGLYDMHGNVLEWCLDQYYPNTYQSHTSTIPALKLYPRVARGGSWYDFPEDCRSATRFPSTKDWKMSDPYLPQSLWYHTDAPWLGFRIVRPLEIPSAAKMQNLWNSGKNFY